ncbi:MAG: hypothetical protein FK734_05365 [Asgard group archaeon]|nr:hypothetical protein [Asgard group archaeon]
MKIQRKRILLVVFMLSLFSITSIMVPLGFGFNYNQQLLTINSSSYSDTFLSTTFKDDSSTAFGWGSGTVTKARDFSLDILDYYYTESPVVDVEVQGREAYLALYSLSQTDAITILDINDPSDIALMGIEVAHTETKAIAVEGDCLVAGQYSVVQNSIVIHDVEDPNNPTWTWAYGTDNFVTDIEFYGHYAFYTSYKVANSRSLRYIDLESPFAMNSIVNCEWINSYALGIEVTGGLVYVAASTAGFYILNITNKQNPTQESHLSVTGNATDVLVDGNFAYVTAGTAGVHIIDVQDPTNPTLISTFNTPGSARKLAKQDNSLFVADENGGVQILDVTDPTNVLFVSDIPSLPFTYDVALFDGILVVGTENGAYTVSIGYVDDFSSSWYANAVPLPLAMDVRVVNKVAYVACGYDGVYAINVSDPLNPTILGNFSNVGTPIIKIDINGRFLYGVAPSGVYIFDISNPADIKLINYIGGSGLTDIQIRGEILFIGFVTGFAILNVSDNHVFNLINNFIPGNHNNITAIWVQGPRVYLVEGVSAGTDTLSCYDITNFNSPFLTFSAPRDVPMYDIQVDGDVCYLGAGNWFTVCNVINPYAFTTPSNTSATSWGVWSFGRYVASAERGNGVAFYNVSYLTNPIELSRYPDATGALQITTDGDFTYVANYDSLVILRHFRSAATTYKGANNFARSTPIHTLPNGTITNATLFFDGKIPDGTSITFQMSVDGIHWEDVTPGTIHVFANKGKTLQWQAIFDNETYQTAYLYSIQVTFDFEYKRPIFNNPALVAFLITGGVVLLAAIITTVVIVIRRKSKIPSR